MPSRTELGLFLTCCLMLLSAAAVSASDRDDIKAIRYLGTVDCYWYPEAQSVLIETISCDSRESIRYEAVSALVEQLQRGRKPLDVYAGWRKVPDPFIFKQILKLASFQQPYTFEELGQKYIERIERQNKENGIRACPCKEDVIALLNQRAFRTDDQGLWLEPSERIREAAKRGLALCREEIIALKKKQADAPPDQEPTEEGSSDIDITNLAGILPGRTQQYGARIPTIAGRADLANRFNVFDNMGTAPQTRFYAGFQYVEAQNNAIFLNSQITRLVANVPVVANANLNVGATANFIAFTGYGSGIGGEPDLLNDALADGTITQAELLQINQELRDRFFRANSTDDNRNGRADGTGRTEAFLGSPNTALYRFGFEYALTPDFSVAMQAQFVQPLLEEAQQPDVFSNPLIQAKHVVYRDQYTLLSALLAVSPQISNGDVQIVEDTTRINPGVLAYHEYTDDLFTQVGSGFSFATEGNQVTTWDYGVGLGYWMYRHASLARGYKGAKSNKFLLGVVPQLEVLGKHLVDDATVDGAFGISADPPLTANAMTLSPVDGSRDIFLPQDPSTRVIEAPFVFEEPRHIVDMTFALTMLFRNEISWTTGVSFPLTGGNARATELLTTLNYGF